MARREAQARILRALSNGDPAAATELLPLFYDELRMRAEGLMHGERTNHTLQATALVHEAYLKLVDQRLVRWRGRTHFMAVAAMTMRRILADHAKGRRREKRGGDRARVSFEEAVAELSDEQETDFGALDESLEKLEAIDPRLARVVEFRFFAGLTAGETAEILGVPQRTVERQWTTARTWLYCQLNGKGV